MIRWVGCVGIVVVSLACGKSPVAPPEIPPTHETWSSAAVEALAMERLTASYPDATVERVAARHIRVERADGTAVEVYLENALGVCQNDPSFCREFVDRVATSMVPSEAPSTLSQVRMTVRHRDYLSQAPNGGMVHDPMPGDLIAAYVFDYPTHVAFMTDGSLADLGVDRETLRTQALANLATYNPSPSVISVSEDPPLFVLETDPEGYTSSVMLMKDRWTSIAADLGGPVLVGVPTRDDVVFCNAQDSAAVAVLRDLTRRVSEQQPYAISDKLYLLGEDGWSVYE